MASEFAGPSLRSLLPRSVLSIALVRLQRARWQSGPAGLKLARGDEIAAIDAAAVAGDDDAAAAPLRAGVLGPDAVVVSSEHGTLATIDAYPPLIIANANTAPHAPREASSCHNLLRAPR